MKLITALDLHRWADKKESEVLMPELVRRLIHSSLDGIIRLTMPSGDSVSLPGFDGELETTGCNAFVSCGKTVFEIGTDSKVKGKADKDIDKRNKDIADPEKQKLNYVFVTPRKWANARKWEKVHREKSEWKDVRVLTAVELEDWISQCPGVAAWLATKMGMLNSAFAIDSPDGFWDRWGVNAKGMRLDYDVLLGGREVNVNTLVSYLNTPNIVTVVSGSTEESLAFAISAILSCKNESLIDKCIVVKDAQTVYSLMANYQNLIIVTNSSNRSFSYGVSENNNSIVYATNLLDQAHYGSKIELSSHDYHKFQDALIKSGMTEVEARKAAKDSGRNVMVLRHQHGFDLTNPDWTKREDLAKVIPAILLGRWSEYSEWDKALLEEFSGLNGDELESLMNIWINIDSSPFQKINHAWYVVSPYDAYLHIKQYITKPIVKRFDTALKKALYDLDPNAKDKLNPDVALYTLGQRKYSGHLRDGLCLSLILMALESGDGQRRVDALVKEILEQTTIEWWLTYSTSEVVSYLAEASPKAFIEYIEQDIKKEDSVVRRLFVPVKKNNYFTGNYEVEYTQILFALNMLAWMPEYLLRISYILAELDKIPNESNYTNRPFNSLMDIYRLWFPQTSVDADGRAKALGALMRKYPETGLSLCIKLVTGIRHQNVSFSSLVSRWRLKDVVEVGSVSGGEIYLVLKKICEIITGSVTPTPEDAVTILDIATDYTIPIEFRKKLVLFIAGNAPHYKGNKKFYERIVSLTNHFKNIHEAKWQISDEEKQALDELRQNVTPENTIDRVEYLLSNQCYRIPEIEHISDHRKRYEKVQALRLDAVNQIVDEIGVDAFINYTVTLSEPCNALMAFARRPDGFDYFEKVYSLLKADEAKYAACRDYFRQLFLRDKTRFITLVREYKDDEFVWFLLSSADPCEEVWQLVDSLDKENNKKYWKYTALVYIPLDRIEYLNKHFMKVERYNEVIQVLYHGQSNYKESMDVKYVFDIMWQVLRHLTGQMLSISNFEMERVMLWIDKNESVTDEEILSIELPYIISRRGSISDWRAYKLVLQSPNLLFELIDYACLPDDQENQRKEMDVVKKDSNRRSLAMFGATMLTEIQTMPCVDENGKIDEVALKEYVDRLVVLGKEKNKLSHVYHSIGRLLACYPKSTTEKPPQIICELIDGIDNKTLNGSYHARIYNRLGSTVRGPFDGGEIEWNKSKRFAVIAKELEVEYPITASIYRSLASDYESEAKRQDEEAEMLKLDS